MLIYCNGDSYTAGSELADYVLGNGAVEYQAPAPSDVNQLAYYRSLTNFIQTHQKESIQSRKIALDKLKLTEDGFELLSKNKAWPGTLKRIDPSLEILNGSKAGSSIDGILQRTTVDLLELKKDNKTPDIVFIQLTSIDRMNIYHEYNKYRFASKPILHYLNNGSTEYKNLATAYLENYKDSELVTIYLYSILMIDSVVKGITGKNPIYLSTPLSGINMTIIMDECSKSSTLQNLYELGNLKNTDANNKSMYDIHTENNYRTHIRGHVEVRTHNKFAEEIYKKYIEHAGAKL